ncbi:hypothetical protein [Nocardia sp. JMUB6875]|uniref:hypothetical protein n=1 Tax=Nocardia sp. JMUB6875 TaxID=3158170 RepID=UPI0034E89E16
MTTPKPFGYWLKHIDKTLEEHFAAILATEGLLRRHWQILHTLSGGPLDADALDVALSPFLNAQDPTAAPYLGVLLDRGWVALGDTGAYAITPQGLAVHANLFERIQVLRNASIEGLSDDEYRTLMDLLQRVAAKVDAFASASR